MSYFNHHGNEITLQQWVIERKNPWSIQHTINGHFVSTVYLGLDHSFDNSKEIYETMVFWCHGDESTYRYQTQEEALEHHLEIVHTIRPEHVLAGGKWRCVWSAHQDSLTSDAAR